MTTVFNAGLLRQRHQQRHGQAGDFVTMTDQRRLPHVITVPGLTPSAIGCDRCREIYHALRRRANDATRGDYMMEVIYDDRTHERAGYSFVSVMQRRLPACTRSPRQ